MSFLLILAVLRAIVLGGVPFKNYHHHYDVCMSGERGLFDLFFLSSW